MVLGIDLGTSCGWAILDPRGQRIASGTWDLSSRRHEGGGMRFLRFRALVIELITRMASSGTPLQAVGYEEVVRHIGTDAAHVYGGLLAMLSAVLEERGVPYRGIPVATVKRRATGTGNADKVAMVRAANSRFGTKLTVRTATKKGQLVEVTDDDDEADALWVAQALGAELGLVEG